MRMHSTARAVTIVLCVVMTLSACGPRYEPRVVPVPDTCEVLVQRAADEGVDALPESEIRQLEFCQQQLLIRAEEEQAAYARYRARSAEFASWAYLVYLAFAVLAFSLDGGS